MEAIKVDIERWTDEYCDVTRTKARIGALWTTKHMNAPYYFSLEFQVGTYLPFLSPVLIALIQTGIAAFRESRQVEDGAEEENGDQKKRWQLKKNDSDAKSN